MKPHLDIITLAVANLERSLTFYRDGMGLATKGIVGTEYPGSDKEPSGAVVFFELRGGLLLALYPRTELAKDAHVKDGPASPLEVSLGYLAESQEAVDELLQRAAAAGAHLPEPAHRRAWGIYSGYFRDPDGHLWDLGSEDGAARQDVVGSEAGRSPRATLDFPSERETARRERMKREG